MSKREETIKKALKAFRDKLKKDENQNIIPFPDIKSSNKNDKSDSS